MFPTVKGGVVPERTPDQRRHRRALVDGASGFPRPHVVLYACVPEGRDPAPVLAETRDYAAARDWRSVAEIVEHATGEASIAERPGWLRVRALIESKHAEGIVMGTDVTCAHAHPDRSCLGQRLAERETAFLVTAARPAGGDRVA
jgi:hypothetical protein